MATAGSRRSGAGEAIARAAETPMIMLNAPLVGNRLGYPDLSGLDLLELFAFVHPARFAVPTPKGIAHALGLAEPEGDEAAALFLREAAAALLDTLAHGVARARGRLGVGAGALPAALELGGRGRRAAAPGPSATSAGCSPACPNGRRKAAGRRRARSGSTSPTRRSRLERLVGEDAEVRDGQRDYAAAAAAVFDPRRHEDQPNLLLAEAGTGIGKTLGYLAPASLWAEQADGAVWVSTYTKALQRQLDREGERLFPDAAERKARIVIRKGRENYLCLLNLEDALQGGFAGRAAILAQLAARWAAYTRDGDMVGGDLPGWLTSLFRRAGAAALDRPARRMRLCRLPALPALLHRARGPRQPGRRPRHRQPRPRHGQRRPRPRGGPGADADRVRRGPSSVRRRRFDLRRRLHRPGGDRAAPLDRRPRRQDARAQAGPRRAADGRRLL